MKKHNKLLLAATLASTLGTAVAGTLTVSLQTHSSEGIEGVSAVQTSNPIRYALGAAYAESDKIKFTFNTDVVDSSTFPSQITVAPVDSATEGDAIAGVVLVFFNTLDNVVSYRVTSVTQPDDTPGDGGTLWTSRTTLGATAVFGTVGYTVASLASGDLTMSVSSATSSDGTLDTDANGTLATKMTQFGTAAMNTQFNNVIDVSTARKMFIPDAVDTMSWAITNPTTTGWLNMATINSTNGTVVSIKGEAGKLAGLTASAFTVAGGGAVTFTESSDQVDVAYSGDVKSDTLTFTVPTGDAAVAMNKQSFTTDLVYNYTTAGATAGIKTIGSGMESGGWKLNGAVVTIPYMPYSDNASQIIYLTNTGKQSGDVLVTAFDTSGNAFDLGVITTTSGGKLTKLASKLRTVLASEGFTRGKLTLTITVEVPKADIIIYASYNIGGADRGFVNTDQYLPQ